MTEDNPGFSGITGTSKPEFSISNRRVSEGGTSGVTCVTEGPLQYRFRSGLRKSIGWVPGKPY